MGRGKIKFIRIGRKVRGRWYKGTEVLREMGQNERGNER